MGRSSTWVTAVTGAALAAALALTGSPARAGTNGEQLQLVGSRHSLLADHYWYEQTHHGLPVLGGFYGEHLERRTGRVTVQNGRQQVRGLTDEEALVSVPVSLAQALSTAQRRAPGAKEQAHLALLPGKRARLVWSVVTDTRLGSIRTLVDAVGGSVLDVQPLVKDANGSGRVFSPSPSATLQNDALTDQDDADYGGLAGAYRTATLTHLNGAGHLRGAFAYAADPKDKLAFSARNRFHYTRTDDRFEQVMAYHHITGAQSYIQSIGFTGVNNEAQDFETTGLTGDNSFYSPSRDTISFGAGGVDDAEDAEIIWHEYGHAIQDAQVPSFGSSHEAASIGEGFSDYWAYTMSVPLGTHSARFPLACIGEWDAVSYVSAKPTCLRRVDGNKHYPEDVREKVHADGEIWSRALYDIHAALGRTATDRIILESQFWYAPDTTFAAAAGKTVEVAQALYGARAATAVRSAFASRGIAQGPLRSPRPSRSPSSP